MLHTVHLSRCIAALGLATQAGPHHSLPSAESNCAIADVCSPQFEVCSSDMCPLADAGSSCIGDGEHKIPDLLIISSGLMFLNTSHRICVKTFLNTVTACLWSKSQLACHVCSTSPCQPIRRLCFCCTTTSGAVRG